MDPKRAYTGTRPPEGSVEVTVGGLPLPHRVRHSPDGFEWGYGGSGPADLALSILWDFLGEEPPASMCRAFKFDHVSTWPREGWSMTQTEVNVWVTMQREGGDAPDVS